jgi:GNAT superfamily N-acetyltransferase
MSGLVFVPFAEEHRGACVALFDQNCPDYFAPNERADYMAFLKAAPAGYRVGLVHGRVVAAFGVVDTDTAHRRRLSWILVAPSAQNAGVGAAMMAEATRAARHEGARIIDIAASHKSAAFFARFGATEIRHTPDGWGPGMHRIDMELAVSDILYACAGGSILLPQLTLVDRSDGGHLIVNPPREVWERSELTRDELTAWSLLVASAGRAMIDVLPQLAGGCVNYWEAGNWALHDEAEPRGPKDVPSHRRVHLHLLGRSRSARHAAWQWGEAPQFPRFVDRGTWAASFAPLDYRECRTVVERTIQLLRERYLPSAPGLHERGNTTNPSTAESTRDKRR